MAAADGRSARTQQIIYVRVRVHFNAKLPIKLETFPSAWLGFSACLVCASVWAVNAGDFKIFFSK